MLYVEEQSRYFKQLDRLKWPKFWYFQFNFPVWGLYSPLYKISRYYFFVTVIVLTMSKITGGGGVADDLFGFILAISDQNRNFSFGLSSSSKKISMLGRFQNGYFQKSRHRFLSHHIIFSIRPIYARILKMKSASFMTKLINGVYIKTVLLIFLL